MNHFCRTVLTHASTTWLYSIPPSSIRHIDLFSRHYTIRHVLALPHVMNKHPLHQGMACFVYDIIRSWL
jgi:hypothetical protein